MAVTLIGGGAKVLTSTDCGPPRVSTGGRVTPYQAGVEHERWVSRQARQRAAQRGFSDHEITTGAATASVGRPVKWLGRCGIETKEPRGGQY